MSTIKNGNILFLNNDNLIPFYDELQGFHHFQVFKITQIPQYSFSEIDKDAYNNNLLRQKMFLDTIKDLFLSYADIPLVVELRFHTNPSEKSIEPYIIIKAFDNGNIVNCSDFIRDFETFLPEDYIYKKIQNDEVSKILELDLSSVVEVRKNISLLPVGKVIDLNIEEYIPGITGNAISEKEPYLVPGIDYIAWNSYNWRSFFRTIQESNNVLKIRISIGNAQVSKYDRVFAYQFYLWLLQTYGIYSNSGGLEITRYLQSLSKYLNPNTLFFVKVQVAANDEMIAKSIANSFSSAISFGNQQKINNLCYSYPPNMVEVHNEWSLCNQYPYNFEKYFPDIPIDKLVDEMTKPFLQRAPYIMHEEEVANIFRLPLGDYEGLPGIVSRPIKPFYQPETIDKEVKDYKTNRKFKLGKIIVSNRTTKDFSFPIDNLTKHGLIVGSTGSGKTHTTLHIINELNNRKIPCLIIEPVKTEYYKRLIRKIPSFKSFHFRSPFIETGEIDFSFLRFNPLEPVEGIIIHQHISYVKDCLCSAVPMYGIMPQLLEGSLIELYKQFKWDLFEKYSSKVNRLLPVFNDLIEIIPKYIKSKFSEQEVKQSDNIQPFKRRLELINEGVLGYCFNPSKWGIPVEKPSNFPRFANNKVLLSENDSLLFSLFKGNYIVELDSLPSQDDKALIMAFLLIYLFEYSNISRDSNLLKHVTVIEEAHRLLSSSSRRSLGGGENAPVSEDSKTKAISLFIDMLAEVRSKGQGLIIVEQIPTKLITDVIKNTNLKIVHRITSKDDRVYLGEAMNMNEQQMKYIINLKPSEGERIVFEESLDFPLMIKTEKFE